MKSKSSFSFDTGNEDSITLGLQYQYKNELKTAQDKQAHLSI